MNRRRALIAIGGGSLLGGGILFGGSLYGSSDLRIEATDSSSVIRRDGERIGSLSSPVATVENSDALLGISLPDRTTVQRVTVEVVWAIRRDGIWSDITVELVLIGDVRANLGSSVATAYSSPWDSSPSEADGSTSSHRRYAYPRGTTAGRVTSLLTVLEATHSQAEVVEVEARLSARSLSGNRVELNTSTELIYSPD